VFHHEFFVNCDVVVTDKVDKHLYYSLPVSSHCVIFVRRFMLLFVDDECGTKVANFNYDMSMDKPLIVRCCVEFYCCNEDHYHLVLFGKYFDE
jgi:hypothetical protein